MSLNRQWFVPGDDIAREVITADIQRYLGPDATVRPGTGTGEYEGMDGFWITAYRTLTSNMIKDLKQDSRRWRAEMAHGRGSLTGSSGKGSKDSNAALVAYQDSQTHLTRQHYGPTPAPGHDQAAGYQQTAPSGYAAGYGNYTHQQPSRGYAQPQQPQYAAPGYQEPVRTAPTYSYTNQDPAAQTSYGGYQQPQQDPRYTYAQPAQPAPRQDIYSPQQQQPSSASYSSNAYGHDGRTYMQQQPPSGRSGRR